MKVQTIPVGAYQTNAYLVLDETTGERMVVDPGDGNGALLEYLKEQGFRIHRIAVTHGHLDHYADAAGMAEFFQVPLYFPKEEAAYLSSPEAQRGPYDAGVVRQFENSLACRGRLVSEGDSIRLGSLCFEVLVLPGHSAAGMCLYERRQGVLFAGDQLFAGSIGRMDLYRGHGGDLVRAVQQKLLTLPDETLVLPGHGPETTIGREKQTNPFLSGDALWDL